MPIITNEVHLDSGESPPERRGAEDRHAESHGVPPLPAQIGALLRRVGPPPLRTLVLPIFNDLARLLGYMSLVEASLSQDDSLQKSGIIFRLVHEKSLALLRHLEAGALRAGHFDEGVREVLDGMGFAIGHELRRVFKEEVPQLGGAQQPPQLTRAELVRAHGLLHNCFQQSTITLAQTFDPALDGSRLFEDYRVKAEQSRFLYVELLSLLRKVRGAATNTGVLARHALANQLKQFRDETMHLLMYKDWAEFDEFVGEVMRTYDEPDRFGHVLHRFESYLGTLVRHVGMRDVLRNQQPAERHDGQPAG